MPLDVSVHVVFFLRVRTVNTALTDTSLSCKLFVGSSCEVGCAGMGPPLDFLTVV